MSTGSDSLYTRHPRFTLNQLLAYQDVDENRESVNRIRDGFAMQHAWGDEADEQRDNAAWAAEFPNWNIGDHVGNIGVTGHTTYFGSGANLVDLAKGATGNACQVLPSFPLWRAGGFPIEPEIYGSILGHLGNIHLAIPMTPGNWYMTNDSGLPLIPAFGAFPARADSYNGGTPQLPTQVPVYSPGVMLGGKFFFRHKVLIYVAGALQGGNWNSISGSTIEILPRIIGIDGNTYDAPDPSGKAVFSDPFDNRFHRFFMCQWGFEWDLTTLGAATQPYQIRYLVKPNTGANNSSQGIRLIAICGIGFHTWSLAASQTPAYHTDTSLLTAISASAGQRDVLTVQGYAAQNKFALWTTET